MLASSAVDFGPFLFSIVAVLVAAKLGGEIAERLGAPSVLGEILAGVAIGPSALGLVDVNDVLTGNALTVLAELGVLLLLLQVGMEMDLAELGKVGKSSMTVAIIGVAAPFAGGTVAGLALGQDMKTAVYVGAALTATSVGITARVFGDLKALSTMESRVVLGAAVADDVLGLVILTVVVKVVTDGNVGVGTVAGTFGLAIGFLLLSGVLGLALVPRLLDLVERFGRSSALIPVTAFAVLFLFSGLANVAKLAPIIGAFMAGLALGKSRHQERVHHDSTTIGHLLVPIFFVQIGINTDLAVMGDPGVIGVAAVLLVIGILGKLVSALGLFGLRADRLLVGIGMVPRGEVGLIFASIGLSNGVLDNELYASLVLVMLVTTLVTPPALRWRLAGTAARTAADLTPQPDEPEPPGGWLVVADHTVDLAGRPPVALTVPIALRAAAAARTARPGNCLLEWIAAHRTRALGWTGEDTALLLDLLREPSPRSMRFLETTGVLERALPEVSIALERRRHDTSELDPTRVLRFPTVDRLVALLEGGDLAAANAVARIDDLDQLVVAALANDVVASNAPRDALLERLVGPEDASSIAQLLDDASLLESAAGDPDSFESQRLLQLAHRLESETRTCAAYVLGLALGELPDWRRNALEELLPQLLDLVRYESSSGSLDAPLVALRKARAMSMLDEPAAKERVQAASDMYVLANQPDELARQARLVEPLPRKGTMRVAVTPTGEPRRWQVEVAFRDDRWALTRLTTSLTDHGLDILQASVTTWPDGAALDTFIVEGAMRPSARELAEAFEASTQTPLARVDFDDLDVTIDNGSLPWHTACTISCLDKPGVLQTLAAVMADCGIVVADARISTAAGRVVDRFALTDRRGRKLDDATISKLHNELHTGAKRRRGRRLVPA